MGQDQNIQALALAVIHTEAQAVIALADQINQQFVDACHLMLACKGRIVVTGMGKSGHIGGKIAATLASTGTPAFFCSPGGGESRRFRHDYSSRCGVGFI